MAGFADQAARKRAQRRGREQGCWVYIDAETLARAGFVPGGERPYYRVWGHQRSEHAGGVVVSLYRER